VRDQRADALAQILVRYSTKVGRGDVCVVQGSTTGEPLVQAVYEEVLRAGGLPVLDIDTEGAAAALHEMGTDEQLDWISPPARWGAEEADVRISIMADANTRALSSTDPSRQGRVQKARKPLLEAIMRRAAAGEHRWALTLFPTHAYAAEAGMSLARYEDFFYGACLVEDPDPVTAWERQSDQVRRLVEWMQGAGEVRLRAPGTDLRLGVGGRRFMASVGEHNMPDGELFTGPLEDATEGTVAFSFPASYGGREVAGVRMRYEGGRVVDASADVGEDYLLEMLDTDPGARVIGELGIGTNFGIATATKEILLDEKIGGTVHLAIGASYPETGGVNESAVHWDMVCDLRSGGSITVDGVELQRDGRFLV
jgi:aminopeptidase